MPNLKDINLGLETIIYRRDMQKSEDFRKNPEVEILRYPPFKTDDRPLT